MGIFGRIFGSDKAVSDITDKDNGLLTQVGQWVGGFRHNESDQADHDIAVREWGLKHLTALEPFKVVQRILAFGAMFMWIFVGMNLVAMMWLEHPNVEKLMEFAFSDYVFWPVLAIFALYTGGGTINSLRKKAD
tara:strand:- start:11276 stop:11677 length:402 start_codon:yes stop_codon:yes gene_type:complete